MSNNQDGNSKLDGKEEQEEKVIQTVRNATDIQRFKLEKLLKQPVSEYIVRGSNLSSSVTNDKTTRVSEIAVLTVILNRVFC